mgnify:FL=1
MTELSPAQKALAAFNERYELCGPFDDDWVEQCLAAALEAVADQVVPDEPSYMRDAVASLDWWDKHDSIRSEMLAIAAELRGTNTQEAP